MSKQIAPISKDLWMPDATSRKCFSCDRNFTAFRRKHHCRFCGLIFCSTCCNKKVVLAHARKPIRICNQCCETLAKADQMRTATITELDDTIVSHPSEPVSAIPAMLDQPRSFSAGESEDSSLTIITAPYLETEDNTIESIINDIATGGHSDFEQACQSFLSMRVQQLIAEHEIDVRWSDLIMKLTRRNDDMSINQYVRVIKVKHTDQSLSQFVNGVVFRKNVAHKKMKNRLLNPNILLLEGGAEFTNNDMKLVSMETVVSQENERQKIFIKKITNLHPSLVIAEKGMSQKTISELSTHSITAIVNIKKSLIDMISRTTRGKILKSIDQASHASNCMGKCDEFVVRPVQTGTLVFLTQGAKSNLGATILISGPNLEELKNVKMAIRQLMVDYRNAVLEADFMQLAGMQGVETVISDNHTSNVTIKFLTINSKKLCAKPDSLKIPLYKEGEDIPLGRKFINFTADLDQLCACQAKMRSHYHIYCKKGGTVTITGERQTEDMVRIEARDPIFVSTVCKICNEKVSQNAPLNEYAWEMSFYKFVNNFFGDTERKHKYHTCAVDAYRGYRYLFQIKNVVISVDFAPRITYELTSITLQEDPEYYDFLRFKTIIDLKEAANEVMTSLVSATSDLKIELSDKMCTEENKEQDTSFEQIKEEISQVADDLSLELAELVKMDKDSAFRNYLQVEAYRRKIFFLVCKAKSVIENSKNSMKTNKSFTGRKRTPDVSQIQSQATIPPMDDPSWDDVQVSRGRDAVSMRLIHPVLATSKLDPIMRSRNFEYIQRGNLTLPLGKGDLCIPVDEEDSLSIIAYALNSVNYYENVGSLITEAMQSEDRTRIDELIHSEMLLNESVHFDTRFSTYDEVDMEEAENKGEMQRLYGPHILYHVTVYYPRQFQALQMYVDTPEKFLLSISKAMRHHYSPGKSGASFSHSHDSKYILKSVDEKELAMFLDLAPNYFRHLFKSFYHSMPSRLVKTVGAYRVSVRNFLTGNKRVDWLLLFENLSINMPRLSQVFDLKGTLNRRRFVKPGESKTKMDLNFLEEMRGMPLFLSSRAKRELDAALWNDTRFLFKQNVIDYSLLLMISDDERKLAMGVIDYMQQYTFEKAVESRYKKAVGSEVPTITNPEEYKSRFRLQVMQEYFIAVDD